MKFILFLILFSFSLLAHDECPLTEFAELKDVKDLNAAIDWHAASDEDINKAACTAKAPPSRIEMSSWLSMNQSAANINKKINGIAFENESLENLEAFRHLTTFVDIVGYKDPAKHKDFTSTCKQVECAVKELFGTDEGLQLLYMQRRYGMNGSHIVRSNASAWKKSELDDVLLSLSDFPEGVLPLQDSRPLIHAPRGKDSGNTLANAIITIFDLWGSDSKEQRRATVTHELGHVLAGVTDADHSADWKKLSGWTTTSTVENGKTVSSTEATNISSIVSEYGQTNEAEDLAEAVVAYRYNPSKLQKASPDKYKMLKSVIFDDVEYTSEEACKQPKRISTQLKSKVEDKIKNWVPSTNELQTISNRCSQSAVEDLIANGYVDLGDNYFKSCYEDSVKKQTVEFLKKELKGLPFEKHLEPMIRNAYSKVAPEKLQQIVSNSQSTHRKAFRDTLTPKDSYSCSPDFLKYGSQNFDEDTLGFKSYYYTEGLNKVWANVCAARANKTFQAAKIIR